MKTATLASVAALLALGLGAAPAAASACPDAGTIPTASQDPAVRAAVTCLINRERAKAHLRQLRPMPSLTSAAAGYSQRMVTERFYSHVDPHGGTVEQRIRASGYLKTAWIWGLGENLAWGSGLKATPEAIVAAWMASPLHRADILMPEWGDLGVGVATGNPYGGSLGATYAAEFGTRTAKPRATARSAKPRPKKAKRRTSRR